MALLTLEELQSTYYKKASHMDQDDVTTYLARANAFCKGIIGGEPPTVDDDLKAIIAMAFEVFSTGQESTVDALTGNITLEAPQGAYTREKKTDPLDTITKMLKPYKDAYDATNVIQSDNGVMFI